MSMSLTYTPVMPTPKQLLLELSYHGLAEEVERMVSERKSWRDIARDVSTRTGFSVSHESLRQWYGAHQAESTETAA